MDKGVRVSSRKKDVSLSLLSVSSSASIWCASLLVSCEEMQSMILSRMPLRYPEEGVVDDVDIEEPFEEEWEKSNGKRLLQGG